MKWCGSKRLTLAGVVGAVVEACYDVDMPIALAIPVVDTAAAELGLLGLKAGRNDVVGGAVTVGGDGSRGKGAEGKENGLHGCFCVWILNKVDKCIRWVG